MNKDLAQGAKSQNQIQKKRKEINPKNQKRKQIKIKKKKNNVKKNESTRVSLSNKENKKEIKNENEIKELSKEKIMSNDNFRYFGKILEKPTPLEERKNKIIINGTNYKKYINNNSIFSPNISILFNNYDDKYLDLLNIEYTKKPQYVIQYRNEIFQSLIIEENNNIPNYKELNNIINEETRNKYILFLISVCDKITKKEEIHYLSINIFDRVLCKLIYNKENLTEKKLQLICFTSLFIAYKYETGCYFLIDDLLKHTEDSLVTRNEVLKYENEINKLLNFEYLIVYPSHFLNHYNLIDNFHNPKIYYFCLYLIDFILNDMKLMRYKKSLIAASCYYIAKANLFKINVWPNIFQFFTGYSKSEIKEASVNIIKTMKNSKNSSIFKCLKIKYSKEEYFKVVDSIIGKK